MMLKLDFNKEYLNEFQEEIKFLINSEIRLKIIGCLYNSAASIKQIEDKTSYSYSSILDNINKLEQRKFIYNIDDKFYLYNRTKLKIIHMLNFNKSANFLRENVEYLNDSLLDINIESTNDLSALEDTKLIKTNNIELFKVIDIFKRSLMGFKYLKGIFPYFHPRHEDIISYWVDNECSVELILPEEVSHAVTDFIKGYLPKSNVKNKDIKLITNDINIEFAFIVSDKCLVLAFYHKTGEFNQHAVLTSTSGEAIQWGLKLFDEYEKLCKNYVYMDDIVFSEDKGV